MVKSKKSLDAREKANRGILIAVVVIFTLAALWGLCRAVFAPTTEPESPVEQPNITKKYEDVLDGRTIDCMPPLSEYEADLCDYAESIDYPNIVY